MPRPTILYSLTACLLLTAACSGSSALPKPASDRPHVVSFAPGDKVERVDAALTLTFDRNMVGIEAVGPALAAAPVHIEPAAPLRVHWQDRKTLVVQPETAWQPGERYAVTLQSPLASQLAPPHSFVFDAQPLHLEYTSLPRVNASRQPVFDMVFSLPVQPEQAAQHCALRSDDGKRVALKLNRVGAEAQARPNRVRFEVVAQLPLHTHYEFDCGGLTPSQGSAPFRADPEQESFTTHDVLALQANWPSSATSLPPEHAELCLELSTPVELEQLALHVHVTPTPEGLDKAWYEGRCGDVNDEDTVTDTHRANSVLLAARRDYHVTIDAALSDVFGQQLGQAKQWSFKTSDRVPGLWTSTGVGSVLEYGRTGHGVGALNLQNAELTCVELSPAQFAAGFESLSTWAMEGPPDAEGAERQPAPWQAQGQAQALAAHVHTLDAQAAPNTARTLPLDLGARCGAGPGRAGLYALELVPKAASNSEWQGDVPARLLSNVTDLGVLAKRGQKSAVVWVTRLSNAALVSQAAVELLDASGRVLARAQTDTQGLARFTRLPNAAGSEFFAVRAADDVAVVGTDWQWREGMSSWQLGVREAYEGDVLLFAHTDRGVYRPGERVLLHGLVRRVSDRAAARVPAERDVHVVLQVGPETLFDRTLQLSDFGSFATEVDLPKHIAPGSHSLRVDCAGKTEFYPVHVAEFRPLTFELTGGALHDEVLAQQNVQLDLSARYLLGAPLTAADLHLTVERTAAQINAPELDAFRFEDDSPALPSEEPWPQAPEGVALERDAKTDAQGRAQFVFPSEATRRPTRYMITVAATDGAQDRASRSFSVLVHSAERYAGTHLSCFVMAANEPVQADVVLVDRTGKRVAGEAEVELRHVRWDCNDPLASCHAQVEVLEKQSVQVAVDNPTHVSFASKTQGGVHVRVSTRDAKGRVARASDSGFVWSGEGTGPYNDRVAATLSVDKRAYRIGERARLALQTPLTPQHLLVTSERADIWSAEVVTRNSGMPSVELGPSAAPNAFLTVTGMTPRAAAGEQGRPRLVVGAQEVRVQGPSRELVAKIVLARDRYEPHERIQGEVQVTHLGRPLLAEVALVAVNESVLQLTGFETPNPSGVFHAPRGLGVRSFSNITRVIADPAQAAAVPETARIAAGGEDGSGGKPELRDDYVAAAYVAPALRTDKNGRVHFAFDAPTDLSAYRLMAVVAAKDDRVGSSDARISVAQPISAHLLAPRFASRGDALELGALVHDTTGSPGPTDVHFQARGIALDHATAQLQANPTGAVANTRAVVQDVDQASFEVELHKLGHSDRVRHELQVRRPLDTELRVLALARSAKTKVRLDWPTGIDRELSQLEITADRAGLSGLGPVLSMVVNYPYGCTEQTAATLSALAAAPELASAIVPSLATRAHLNARIADGIGRLLQARAADGRFGLYPGMSGRLWLTALVFEAALALRVAGFEVPETLIREPAATLSEWLTQQNLRKLAPAELEQAAHAAWLLARASTTQPSQLLDQLFAQRQQLTLDGVAYLLLAAVLDKKPAGFRAELRAKLRDTRWLERPRDPEQPLVSAERSAALALAALEADGQEPELRTRLARWLIDRASDPAVYMSTRDVAETLSALAIWARSTQAGASQLRIGLGDQVLWQGPLSGAQVVAISRSAATASAGDVWLEADAEVSVSIRRRDISASAPKPAFSHGVSLNRRYLQPKTGKPLTEIALGDVVQVELELRSERALRMLALTDPMPAGLEPLDPGLSSGRFAGCDSCNETGGFDHMHRHDDRVEAFAEWLPAGKHTLRYLLRATTAGSFSAPGAAAQLMYMPDFFARSRVDNLRVRR